MQDIFKKLVIATSIPVLVLFFTLVMQIDLPGKSLLHCLLITFALHWSLGLPSILLKTERLYDISGMLAVLAMLLFIVITVGVNSSRSQLLLGICCMWTLRLGLFLFIRVLKHKHDSRFDALKESPLSFLIAWNLSAVWTFLTTMAVLVAMLGNHQQPLAAIDMVPLSGWFLAFIVEIVADYQKYNFKNKYGSNNFIQTGLWQYCRHPNYSAEILMWAMVAVLALPNLQYWGCLSLLSPVFVTFFLTKISGVNILEQRNDNRYGDMLAYKNYKKNTPALMPKLSLIFNK